ncbi:NADH dehydrogenase [invertebrate metagenome]|uniref:NADH dehydrogenase n=1 Tax=invertebrate metagenome TaxID=1711999 RepID=A0A2H9T6Z2_9ZZZZ
MAAMAKQDDSTITGHHIVIVGGGAGGLELATRLGKTLGKKGKARVTLIDANTTHLWKPLLHEVAAGSLNAFEDELSYLAQAKWNHFCFILGTMSDLDREQRMVTLAPVCNEKGEEIVPVRTVGYTVLVIAVGSQANDFDTQGARDHCLFIDNRHQAERIHNALLNHYMKAQADFLSAETSQTPLTLKISIIGAGATGVELAAELHHAAIELERYGLTAIPHKQLEITVIEGSDQVLPALPDRIGNSAKQQLEKMGIRVLMGQRVSRITGQGLILLSGEMIPSDLKIWAAGVKAPAFLSNLDELVVNGINQLVVRPTLQTESDDAIYAMGDCACCKIINNHNKETVIPPRAQAAHQQASLLAKSLTGVLEGNSPLPFIYRDYGSLVSLSRFGAVGNLMGSSSRDLLIEGRLAKLFYISLYRMHQFALFGKVKTVLLIIRDFLGKTVRPQLKLH